MRGCRKVSKSIVIRVDEETYKRLLDLSFSYGWTMSKLVRKILSKYIGGVNK